MQLITREELKATLDANDDSRPVMVVGPWEFEPGTSQGHSAFPAHGRGWPRWTATTKSSSTLTTTIA
jgi:hypothetical protein